MSDARGRLGTEDRVHNDSTTHASVRDSKVETSRASIHEDTTKYSCTVRRPRSRDSGSWGPRHVGRMGGAWGGSGHPFRPRRGGDYPSKGHHLHTKIIRAGLLYLARNTPD